MTHLGFSLAESTSSPDYGQRGVAEVELVRGTGDTVTIQSNDQTDREASQPLPPTTAPVTDM
jgi:hypothetical protein